MKRTVWLSTILLIAAAPALAAQGSCEKVKACYDIKTGERQNVKKIITLGALVLSLVGCDNSTSQRAANPFQNLALLIH